MVYIFLIAAFLGFFISVPIGPVGVLVARNSLEKGKISAFFTGLGASISDIFYASIVLFNLSFISAILLQYKQWIQLIGFFIIVFLAYKSLTIKNRKEVLRSEHQFDPLFAFFINLTNPAVILLFSVLFSYFHINLLVHSSYEVYVFLFGLLIGSLSWWVFLSSTIIYLRKYVKGDILLYVHKISGILLMLFAFVTQVDTLNFVQ